MIGILFAIFLVWAALTPIEEMASASGQVVPSGYIQSVQHLEGGTVQEILVHDGDLVEKDQPLIRLDDTSAAADLGQMRARQQALAQQAERLRSFTDNKATTAAPMTEDETAILNSMTESRDSQRNVLRDQIAQKEKELSALVATHEALNKNVALMEQENTIRQNLTAKGYGSQLMALNSQRDLNQLLGQRDETASEESRARDAVREAQNKLQSLDADLKQQAMKTLGDVEAQLAEVNKLLDKYEHTANHTLITAPVRGIVKGLTVHSIGAVAEPGKLLLEIVPVNEELMVEAQIPPSDVGHLKPGQSVKVKVSAYEFSRYGNIPGTLESVSASTFQNEEKQSFYKTRIKLEKNYAGNDASRNLILPGMTVQADIVTGEKSILGYLLRPIQVAMEGSFHEH
jgi:HlyD family secretion protein/adhesin transport system membrane fusion protein